MIKYISLLIIAILLLSCGGSKSTASRNSRSVYKKPSTSVAVRKPATRSTTTRKTTTDNSSKTVHSNSTPETLEATSRVKVTTEIVLAYIANYKETAKSNMARYGVPSSIILAQGILESGAGTGSLSARANNHFGIKCHKEWTGPSVKHDDDSEQECFRKYADPDESYRDHSLFLTTRSRYGFLFNLDKGDYKAWAKGLRAAGYATDVKYPDKLVSLIERYQLDRFDAEVLGKEYLAMHLMPGQSSENIYQVTPGDTLYSISKKFSLSVDDIKRLNRLDGNAISIGQNLKIK